MTSHEGVGGEVTLLSAGAVEPGVAAVLDAFQRDTGQRVRVTFATAPMIRKRVTDGESADVLIAPPPVLDDLVKAGKIKGTERVTLGRVGVGVTVREGAPVPEIGTVDEFKQSLLSAESLVYNQASTGLYLEGLFERLGIAEQVKAKATRHPNGAAVFNHVLQGKGREIGFGPITEIVQYGKRGLRLVGPLPAQIQNYTSYAATVMRDGAAEAQSLVRYIASPPARAALAAAGIES